MLAGDSACVYVCVSVMCRHAEMLTDFDALISILFSVNTTHADPRLRDVVVTAIVSLHIEVS